MFCEALKLVPRQWRGEFTRFVDEGEASAEFLAYLDQDGDCRQACEMVFRADNFTAEVLAAADSPAEAMTR
jgi:hypothetical protein